MDNKKKLILGTDTMSFRKIYWPLIRDEKMTKVFRPGVRPCGSEQGYCSGNKVKLCILEKVGVDWALVRPVLSNDMTKDVIIEKVEVREISSLKPEDFVGATPDVYDQESLRYNLGIIYNLLPEEIDLITITSIKYK